MWNLTQIKTKKYERSALGLLGMIRSSRPEAFYEKDVLRNFAKFTGKHLCQGLFFNKLAGPRPATLFKKRLWRKWFPVNFAKFLRTPFLTERLCWLLLYDYFINKRELIRKIAQKRVAQGTEGCNFESNDLVSRTYKALGDLCVKFNSAH